MRADFENETVCQPRSKVMTRFTTVCRLLLQSLAGLLMFCGLPLQAQVIEDIRFASLPGDRFQVDLLFDNEPPEPDIFEIENPARLSVDFEGVGSALAARRFPLEFRNAESVVVLESGGRTRMVLNLVNPTSHSYSISDNRFSLIVGGGAGQAQRNQGAGTVSGAGEDESDQHDITGLDFRRDENGAGLLVVELANSDLVGELERGRGRLTLTFDNATMPADLEARLDVMDFGTPIQSVDAYQRNGNVVLEAAVDGDYDYIAYRARGDYTLSVSAAVAEDAGSGNEFPFSGEPISLNFQDIDVRTVLQMLADVNDFSLVAGDSVSGNITLRLDDVPWDQALDLVLRARGLDKRVVGNVMYIAPVDEIAQQELQQLENRRQAESLAPLRTEYLEVNYAAAVDIVRLLTGQGGPGAGNTGGGAGGAGGGAGGSNQFRRGGILSDRGSVTVDERTNTLIVQDVATKIDEVRELLEILDVPVRQVLIEARIVNASTNFSRSLGIRWGGVHNVPGTGDQFILGGSMATTVQEASNIANYNMQVAQAVTGGASLEEALATTMRGPVNFPDALGVDLGVENATSSLALGYAGTQGLLELELSALEATGNGEVIAQPHITTQDKQTAVIQSGIQVPYQAQAGGTAGGSTTEFVPAVLKLEVTPQITPDGRIIMQLIVNQDSVVTSAGAVPAIATNSAEARVLVDDGATIVLGGVFREEVTTTVSKTPLLGDIPYVGNLFKRTENQETKTELLIFITPSILSDLM